MVWCPGRLHISGSVVATWWGHHLPTAQSFWNVLWCLFDLWGLCIKLLRPWDLLLQCNFANTGGKECNLLTLSTLLFSLLFSFSSSSPLSSQGWEKTLEGDGYVHGPKVSDGFMGVYASLNPSSYILKGMQLLRID